MQHMDWDDLRFFLAVVREGSIRAAAKSLAVNQSTVSRRIDAFEKKIDARLFDRLPSGYVMTITAEEMRSSAERMENEVAALNRHVIGRDSELRGNLRVTLPEIIATHFLMPKLVTFSECYPGIQLEVVASSDTVNLSKREADVAIRLTNTPPEQAVGRKVVTVMKAVYASKDYLAKHNLDGNRSTLRWIGWDDSVKCPNWNRGSDYSELPTHHQTNNMTIQFEATKAGLGLSMLPCFVADPEPSLTRLPPGDRIADMDIWVLTHRDLRNTARVRAFMGFMVEAIEKERDLFEGIINTPQ